MDKGQKAIIRTMYEMAKEEKENKKLQKKYIKAIGSLVKTEEKKDMDFAE